MSKLVPFAAMPRRAAADPLPEDARYRLGTARLAHSYRVVGVRFAPAGTLLSFSVEAGSRVTIAEWDAATAQEPRWTYILVRRLCSLHLRE